MLCSCAEKVGLDAVAARRYLEDKNKGYDEVRASVEENARLGIHSIPVFVFNYTSADKSLRKVVHGSADVAAFGAVFDEILRIDGVDTKEEL